MALADQAQVDAAPPFRKVVVATDFGVQSARAAALAADLASRSAAQLTLVHVVEPVVVPYPIVVDAAAPAVLEREAQRALDAELARVRRLVPDAESVVLGGTPADEVMLLASRTGADLIVTGTHGRRPFERWMLGSVAEKMVRTSRIPVLVVHDAARPFRRILAATDFGVASEHAVALAARVARSCGARMTLLHVVDDVVPVYAIESLYKSLITPTFDEQERRAREELADTASVVSGVAAGEVSAHIHRGKAAVAIAAEAETGAYDLVAVGTHGRNVLTRLLVGSVAEKLVRHAPCPVLVVRGER